MVAIYRLTLGLQTVAIQGNRFVTQDEILRAIGSFQGKNAVILSLSGRLNRRISQALPKVKAVSSDYKWPHAIQLTVVEKTPWLVFNSDIGPVIVAGDGTVLERRNPGDETVLPKEIVTVESVNPVYFAQKTINPYLLNALTPVVAIIREYFPDQELHVELKGLVMAPGGCSFDEIIIIKDDDVPVYMGSEARIATKLSALRQFLWYVGMEDANDETHKKIRYIDLRVDGKVLVGYGT